MNIYLQGFVVALMCCFLQPDVRLELIYIICELLDKLKCCAKIKCFKCFSPDYVNTLRQNYLKHRSGYVMPRQQSTSSLEYAQLKRSISRTSSCVSSSFQSCNHDDHHNSVLNSTDRLSHSSSHANFHHHLQSFLILFFQFEVLI